MPIKYTEQKNYFHCRARTGSAVNVHHNGLNLLLNGMRYEKLLSKSNRLRVSCECVSVFRMFDHTRTLRPKFKRWINDLEPNNRKTVPSFLRRERKKTEFGFLCQCLNQISLKHTAYALHMAHERNRDSYDW